MNFSFYNGVKGKFLSLNDSENLSDVDFIFLFLFFFYKIFSFKKWIMPNQGI